MSAGAKAVRLRVVDELGVLAERAARCAIVLAWLREEIQRAPDGRARSELMALERYHARELEQLEELAVEVRL